MFHEEKIILGVLCWRDTPDGEWTEFTAHQLTRRFSHLSEEARQLLTWNLPDERAPPEYCRLRNRISGALCSQASGLEKHE